MIGDLVDVIFLNRRSIGGIFPNVSIEEMHTDSLTITQHPVQQGASIVDHAFKNPAELVMRVGWSNSSAFIASFIGALTGTGGAQQDVSAIYDQLLTLQSERVPFDVVTGKRTYSNMLIKQLQTTTDINSEFSLIITVHLQQLIIVQIANQSSSPYVNEVPANEQAAPQITASPKQAGVKQTIPAPATVAALALTLGL